MSLFTTLDGTILNALTVMVGGVLGTIVGNRLPERIHESLFGVLGLFVVLIGLLDAIATRNALIVLGSLLIGTMLGEIVNIDRGLQRLGDWVQRRVARTGSTVSEAFVTSSLVFCVGPLSILGALDNGLRGDTTKLAIKSVLDGFSALAFSAALGWGVLLSVVVILVYQGGLSLGAHVLAPALGANPTAIIELTATGGLILVAIGLKLLKVRDLRVANFLPALAIAPLLVAAVAAWQRYMP
ncbi:MAG: DUF554 domain-containing protein [Ktedonobacterales bacterium]|nr:DUF554 domain-containing protein [Ktedonobacterales bacterium]